MSVPFLKMFWRHFCISTLSYFTTNYGHQFKAALGTLGALLDVNLGCIHQYLATKKLVICTYFILFAVLSLQGCRPCDIGVI